MKEIINKIIEEVREIVIQEGNQQDLEYFEYHQARYEYMANSVSKLISPGAEVLEMGSHYLHSSLILTKLGYKVYAMDVEAFWKIPHIEQRGVRYGIEPIIENNLESLHSQEEVEEKYDLVLFTEILEHITFNPINFWRKVYRSSKDGGLIYISTPNSFALPSFLRAIKNLLTFKSIGLGVDQIFSNVTYGHHWKEYSAREIKYYFFKLSDAFKVTTRKYSCDKFDSKSTANLIWSYLIKIGNLTYVMSSDIEAIITITKSEVPWKIEAPQY